MHETLVRHFGCHFEYHSMPRMSCWLHGFPYKLLGKSCWLATCVLVVILPNLLSLDKEMAFSPFRMPRPGPSPLRGIFLNTPSL